MKKNSQGKIMAVSHCLTFCLTIIFPILTLHCSASSSSSSIASNQLKFWSENVHNTMPNSILKKLSPLTQKDSDYYTNILLKDDEFTADANFCSLANLACESVFDNVKTVTQTYTQTKTYGASPGLRQMKTNEDPFSFFRQSILKRGNLIHLPNLQESLPNRAFLPTQIVSNIPLTYEAITKIFPKSSVGTTKETIQASLSYCNADPIEGETKSCPKSLQEMVGFAKSALGEKKLWALTSKIESDGLSSKMMIREMKQYPVEKIVACHEAFLPFAAYFCHSLPSTRLYQVKLVDPYHNKELESVNTMLAICHMDTSSWPTSHVAFQMLKFGPGEGEACHWFTHLDLAWISM